MVFTEKTSELSGEKPRPVRFRIRRLRPTDLTNFIELGLPTCAFMHGRRDVPGDVLRQNFAGFVREHAHSEESDLYVAEDLHGRYAGQLWLHSTRNRFNGHRELWIWDVSVVPDFRGQGLGKQLLDYAKLQAAIGHFEELWLLVSSVNDIAIQLYRTSGLQSLGQLMCISLAGEAKHAQPVQFGATLMRPLASKDAEELHNLWTASSLPFRPRGRDSLSRLRAFLSDSHDAGWCATIEKQLIGAALIGSDGRKGWIERLAVHPDFRRGGLAKAIITACMTSLKSRGILVISALIDKENEISRSLFESCGFVHHVDLCYYSQRDNPNN